MLYGYHNSFIPIEDGLVDSDGVIRDGVRPELKEKYKNDFPIRCECGYRFKDDDQRQIFSEAQYEDEQGNIWTTRVSTDTTFLLGKDAAPVGAMWSASWLEDMPQYTGPDGLSLHLRTPYGDWLIDRRSESCTRKEKKGDIHKCWIRHGTPPNITITRNDCNPGENSVMFRSLGTSLIIRNGEIIDCGQMLK